MKAENEAKNMFKTKSIFLLITIILGIIAVVLGVTYAYWKTSFTQEGFNTVASQCFKIDFQENNDINLTNTLSMLNSEGEQLTPYTLKIKNVCESDVEYQVNIETMNTDDKLDDKYITAKVNYGENKVLTDYEKTTGIIDGRSEAYKVYTGHLKKDQVMNIDIRMWMGEEVELYEDTEDGGKKDISDEITNKTFKSKVTVEATIKNQEGEYQEEILNGAYPVLGEGLIPVTIGNNGTVTRADTTKKWYNYANSEWANAVILKDEAENQEPEVGAEIQEDDIESYFVWIPKYSYQIQTLGVSDTGQEKAFSIRFGIEDTKDETKGECTTPMNEDRTQGKSGESEKCQVGDYMTHPAFISMKANGLWVGKFETGYKDAQTKEGAQQNLNTKDDEGKSASKYIIIKPNTYSWTNISVANAFQASYQYLRNLESHMMKNTEWGSVAYLTNSIYGRCTSSNGCEEIMINNNGNHVTGYASKIAPTAEEDTSETAEPTVDGSNTVSYTNALSVKASTTGNYSGVYDMSGGVWEWMMGFMLNQKGQVIVGKDSDNSTGFIGIYGNSTEEANGIAFPDSKYYDVYKYGTDSKDFTRRILGDCRGETAHWYNDFNWVPNYKDCISLYGGSSSNGFVAGVFGNTNQPGTNASAFGFRIVLAPQSTP